MQNKELLNILNNLNILYIEDEEVIKKKYEKNFDSFL